MCLQTFMCTLLRHTMETLLWHIAIHTEVSATPSTQTHMGHANVYRWSLEKHSIQEFSMELSIATIHQLLCNSDLCRRWGRLPGRTSSQFLHRSPLLDRLTPHELDQHQGYRSWSVQLVCELLLAVLTQMMINSALEDIDSEPDCFLGLWVRGISVTLYTYQTTSHL